MNKQQTQKKTMLFVAPYYPPHGGGLERYVSEIATRLDTEKWNTAVLTTGEDKGACVTEEVEGVTVYRLPVHITISNTPFSFSWFVSVYKLLKKLQPDIINVHMPLPGLGDVVTLLKKRGTPLVVTYHTNSMKKGHFFPNILVQIYESIPLRFLLWRAHHIVCVSDSVRKGFLKDYKHKSSTITPGVDVERFVPDKSLQKKGNILFVAGLKYAEKYKGLETLLDAFVEVRKKVPHASLTIVGEGDRRGWYEKRTVELGVSEYVHFKGFLSGEALVREFQNASVFALPTENESFGMVIAEAMATGLPVVSTDVGGVPYLVEHDVTGILTKPKDTKRTADALLEILSDESKAEKFGVQGREKISQGYTWERRSKQFEELCTVVLNKKHTIAHIVGYYPPHAGGMEVVAEELAHAFVKKDYNTRVFTSDLGAKELSGKRIESGCEVYRYKSIDVAHTPIIWKLPYGLLTLPRQTVLHVHVSQVGIPELALFVAKLRKFPLVFHFHLDVEPSGMLGSLFLLYKKYVLGFVLRRGDKVVVFSEEQKQFVIHTYRVRADKAVIIPNGVSEVYFTEEEHKEYGTPLSLICVGRLTVQKRVERVVEAMKFLESEATFVVVGDGEDMEKLKKIVKDKEIRNVTFVGRKTPSEVREYYKKADVYVASSDKEGMSISVLEAMAAGLPVVASNVMGLREAVQDVGVLVDDLSPEGFADALHSLAHNHEQLKKCRAAGLEKARTLSWKNIATVFERVYLEIKK